MRASGLARSQPKEPQRLLKQLNNQRFLVPCFKWREQQAFGADKRAPTAAEGREAIPRGRRISDNAELAWKELPEHNERDDGVDRSRTADAVALRKAQRQSKQSGGCAGKRRVKVTSEWSRSLLLQVVCGCLCCEKSLI